MEIHLSRRISQSRPYAFAELEKKVADCKRRGMEVIDLGVGDPTSPTPPFVIEALSLRAQFHARTGYPSYIGSSSFRLAAACYMKRNFGVVLDPEREIMSNLGAKEAVFNFPLGFLDPGDTVICPTPGYPPYKNGTLFAGGIPYFVPLLPENGFLIDFESIPAEICRRSRFIWINYPNSPTGKVAPRDWFEVLVRWAHRNEILIASDEGCYIDIYFGQKPSSLLEVEREGVIAFYSLSKRNNMTGYRVGFNAGDKRIIDAFKKVKRNIDSGTPDFIQDVAAMALDDTDHVEAMRSEYREKRDLIMAALKRAGLPPCSGDATFYLWQRAPAGLTGTELAEKFLSLGIIVTPGEWISDPTETGLNPGRDFIRLALVPPLEEVRTAADKIASMKL